MRRRHVLALGLVAALAVGGALAVWVRDLPLDRLRTKRAPAPSAFLTLDGMDVHGSRLVILDGLGHVPQEEDPRRSVEPVDEFLG